MAKLVTLIAGAVLVTRGFGQLRGPRAIPPAMAAPQVPFGSLTAETRRSLVEPVRGVPNKLRDHYYMHNGEKHYYKFGSVKYKEMMKEKKKKKKSYMKYQDGWVVGEKYPPKIRIDSPYVRKKWQHILPKNFSWPVSRYVEEGGTPAPGYNWRTETKNLGNPTKMRSRKAQWSAQDILDYREGRSMWNMTLTPDMVNRLEYNRIRLLQRLPGNREYKMPKYLIFGKKRQRKYGAPVEGGEDAPEAPSLSSFSDDGAVRLVGITAFAVAMVILAVVSVSLERRPQQVTNQGLLS